MNSDNYKSIPILYYHSVASHDQAHPWSFLSVDIVTFKSQMKYLFYRGYSTCNWAELYDHLNGVKKLNKKTVFIQFDDGFLDNWTVVYPIMEKYKFKYTVLITPEFVEKSNKIRPFVKQTTSKNKENWWGYLNESEIKKMSDSGLVDFQGHGHTHTWFESSDVVLNYYDGTQFYPHLHWNLNKNLKPYWLTRFDEMKVEKGTPIFEFKKSLELEHAFIPNQDFIDECISFTKNLDSSFEGLKIIYNKYKTENKIGVFETQKEAESRLNKELLDTKKYIETLTKKDSNFLVFPGGGNNPKIIKALKEFKFKLVSKGKSFNSFNSKNFQISRVAGFHNFKIKGLNTILNIILIEIQIRRGAGNRLLNFIINKLK